MPNISFAELTKHVHLINDLILSDMTCDNENSAEEALSFSKHLLATKYWFARISAANKKLYVLALLEDIRSAWALSLLLKSMWNCRPKDAVLSANEYCHWSSYDQVPMDHNRTAIPIGTLAQVMKADRMWFLTLDPESQAMMLSELLTVSGGPVMWEVLKRAQILYERYRNHQLKNLLECIVIDDEKGVKSAPVTPRNRSPSMPKEELKSQAQTPNKAHTELEANLTAWNATIKTMRDSLKLEEMEMTFKDGTKTKIWKVNRPKPEAVETVDFLQLLPSSIGKRIISYLPRAQLGDYARVNKYWSYLVDEFRAELAARIKINADYEKLHDVMLRYDTSMDMVAQIEYQIGYPSSQGVSVAPSVKVKQMQPSMRASEKSGGAYSIRRFLGDRLNKPRVAQKPIRNVAEITELLEQRGAANENLWKWCDTILKHRMKIKKDTNENRLSHDAEEGVLTLGNLHFPCPMMKHSMKIPLNPPLYKDPANIKSKKSKQNVSNANLLHTTKDQAVKRFSLWTRNFSSLYHVYKIPSYQSPF